jgi:hypothetical protein
VEIRSFSSESTLTLWYRECDIEITISIISLVSFSSELDRHTILDSLWDIDRFLDFLTEFAMTMTMSTFLDDFLTSSSTGSTWSSLFHHTEYGLYSFTNLSVTVTAFAGFGFTSFTTTVMTGRRAVELYLATHSEYSIFERDP